jgi:cellulose biosynthesis protein BcsQ
VPGRNIWLFIGDLLLSDFESLLSQSWIEVLAAQQRGFRITSALFRLYSGYAIEHDIDYVIIDVGPNLGSLNRSLLLGCDHFIVPMIPDLFSLRGSQNLGRVMSGWVRDWHNSVVRVGELPFDVQDGRPLFTGYVLQLFNIYRQRPTKAWEEWTRQVPNHIHQYVVTPLTNTEMPGITLVVPLSDYQIGEVKNYHSLIPMAQAALKPVFELGSSDGVVGAHQNVVAECGMRHQGIADRITQLIR